MIYAFPSENENKLKTYVYPYVYPYFHQSWSMFAPIPKQNYNIYVKYEGADWYDVFNEIVAKHQHNRLAGYENISLALSSAVRYYASSVNNESKVEQDSSNINLIVIKKIIMQHIDREIGRQPKDLELIIRIKDVNGSEDNAHYYIK